MDPRGLRVTKNKNFSFLAYTKQLLTVTFCNKIARIRSVTEQAAADASRRMDRGKCGNSCVDHEKTSKQGHGNIKAS